MEATRTERREAWLHQLLHTGNPGDVEFYLSECEGARRVAELGCGSGRILEPLARRGHEVVGIELHPGMICLARERLQRHGESLCRSAQLVRADMRAPGDLGLFDRILIPYNGLLCLTSSDDVCSCFAWAARSLAPGGVLVFDVYDPPDPDIAEAAGEGEIVGEERPIVAIEEEGLRIVVTESDVWSPTDQRVDASYRYEIDGDEGCYEVSDTIAQRYLYPEQIRELLDRVGLRAESLARVGFGESDRRGEHGAPAEQIVVHARRATEPSEARP